MKYGVRNTHGQYFMDPMKGGGHTWQKPHVPADFHRIKWWDSEAEAQELSDMYHGESAVVPILHLN